MKASPRSKAACLKLSINSGGIRKTFQLTPEDLFSSTKKGKAKSKAPPKYRDPETGKTWTGRGPIPSWLKDKNRDDYLIEA